MAVKSFITSVLEKYPDVSCPKAAPAALWRCSSTQAASVQHWAGVIKLILFVIDEAPFRETSSIVFIQSQTYKWV